MIGRTVSVKEYLSKSTGRFKEIQDGVLRSYELKTEVVQELSKYSDDLLIVIFSAEWCLKDCATKVPIFLLLAENLGIEVRVFGGLVRDALKSDWRVPPTPPEVREHGVKKVPHVFILDKSGRQLGEIVESPSPGNTVEEDVLQFARKTG